jgi:hypothetical protein
LSNSKTSLSDKKNIDWLSTLLIIGALSILFFITYRSEGVKTAVLTIAILFALPVSLALPHLISKLKNQRIELKTATMVCIYILCLLIIAFIADDWRIVLMFPAISFLWWFMNLIWKIVKLLIAKLFDNGNT